MKGLVVADDRMVRSAALRPGRLAALLPVVNQPLALHALATVRGCGAREVGFVVAAARAQELADALARAGLRPPVATLIPVPEAGSPADALRAAQPFLEGGRCIVHRADGIWTGSREPLRRALRSAEEPVRLFVQPLGRRLPAVAGRIRLAEAPGGPEYEVAGVHVVDAHAVDELEALLAGGAHEAAAAGPAELVRGQWVPCDGTAEGVVAANRAALDEMDRDDDLSGCSECRVEGRVRVHPSARVSQSLLRGPVAVGPGAHVETACLGPFTAVGGGAVVENSDILGSVLCEGAVVRDVGGRIDASVIGPGAIVRGDFRLPKGLRLAVGAEAEVTVA